MKKVTNVADLIISPNKIRKRIKEYHSNFFNTDDVARFSEGPLSYIVITSMTEQLLSMIIKKINDTFDREHFDKDTVFDITRKLAKDTIMGDKKLESLFHDALVEYKEESDYGSMTIVSNSEIKKIIKKLIDEEDVKITKHCLIFIRYLMHFVIERTIELLFLIKLNTKNISITPDEAKTSLMSVLKQSLYKKFITKTKQSVTDVKQYLKQQKHDIEKSDNDGTDDETGKKKKKTTKSSKKKTNKKKSDSDSDGTDEDKPKKKTKSSKKKTNKKKSDSDDD